MLGINLFDQWRDSNQMDKLALKDFYSILKEKNGEKSKEMFIKKQKSTLWPSKENVKLTIKKNSAWPNMWKILKEIGKSKIVIFSNILCKI